jgi:hypothetical protein
MSYFAVRLAHVQRYQGKRKASIRPGSIDYEYSGVLSVVSRRLHHLSSASVTVQHFNLVQRPCVGDRRAGDVPITEPDAAHCVVSRH